MTDLMLKYWAPERDQTTWTMRARTRRKNHSRIVAERDRINYVFQAKAEDLRGLRG